MRTYYTYILQSQQDDSFYIGVTEDLLIRLKEHNSGLSKYTSRKKPWKLVYYEKYETLSDSRKREIFLKRQKNRSFYLRLINGFDPAQLVIPSTRDDCYSEGRRLKVRL